MKIVHIIQRFGGGGRERRMVQLVRELSRYSYVEQAAIVYFASVQYKEVEQSRLKVYVMTTKGHFKRAKQMASFIKEFKPDIVHSWVDTPLELFMMPLLKRKYNYHYLAGFVADGNKIKHFSIRGWAIRFTFMFADAIVSNSYAGLKAKKASSKKSYVIYNGFDFNRFPPYIDREGKRKELGIKAKYIVSMIARMTRAKDWQSFVDIAEMAEADKLDVFFLAVGEGDMLQHYKTEAVNRGVKNIRFLGRRSDIEELLKITDVSMLFTSEVHAEGVSNSIMEAMAAGLPVIATEGGGTTEIITDGLNGYIIPLHDKMKAYKLMKNLLVDKSQCHFIGCMAEKHIRENFQLSHMGNEYIALYNKLTKK